ncbi:hypothetical protein Anas_08618 [Armadillidium nasatum]|uniref:Dehydrogenase/reductase SDR family member 12 n=1 Tax=Armadillidium nasatum TaxID=96803 RepID=A0A5N5TIJ4_9CRUS|nr:hypothetical protein Anas_08618 [Armadillidium nasatum]
MIWVYGALFIQFYVHPIDRSKNAGCMINQKELTEEGLEKNFATNTLGMHLLTTGLVPLLQKSKNPRVVTVSSGGMLVQKLKKDDLQFEQLLPFDGTMAYAQNKRQQVDYLRLRILCCICWDKKEWYTV